MPKAKKQSKLKRTLNLLKPNTRLKQLVLFVVLVGAVGGGYSVYRSHAATWAVYPVNFNYKSGAYKSTDCNGNKGCVSVAKLPSSSAGTVESKIYVNFPTNKDVAVCFTARAQLSLAAVPTVELFDANTVPGVFAKGAEGGFFSIPKGTAYNQYCGWTTLAAGSHFIYPNVRNTTPGSADVYITQMTLAWN